MEISELVAEAYEIQQQGGWPTRSVGDCIALMHSELSEALEEYRKGFPLDVGYIENDKPEGFTVELADTIIRILSFCGEHKLPIAEAIRTKMDYNRKRPFRHGGKIM